MHYVVREWGNTGKNFSSGLLTFFLCGFYSLGCRFTVTVRVWENSEKIHNLKLIVLVHSCSEINKAFCGFLQQSKYQQYQKIPQENVSSFLLWLSRIHLVFIDLFAVIRCSAICLQHYSFLIVWCYNVNIYGNKWRKNFISRNQKFSKWLQYDREEQWYWHCNWKLGMWCLWRRSWSKDHNSVACSFSSNFIFSVINIRLCSHCVLIWTNLKLMLMFTHCEKAH